MEKINVFKANGSAIPFKIIAGVILTVLLLISMQMIENLINERSELHNDVIRTISRDWGKEQTMSGPFLVVPLKDSKLANLVNYYNQNGVQKRSTEVVEMVFTPDQLQLAAETKPTFKHRGIYKYVVYTSEIQLNGNFDNFDFTDIRLKNKQLNAEDLDWEHAELKFDISDAKGISGETNIHWDSQTPEIKPVNNSQNKNSEGFYCHVKITDSSENKFVANIKLKGSQGIHFIPVGKISNVSMNTFWASPKFTGTYSPDSSRFDGKNYSSSWSISQLARPIPNSWLSNQYPALGKYSLGVEMLEPVDKYQQTLRSAKYSILFIILSFLTVFFTEFFSKKETNILQYLLIGLALVLFYSLLLSLTEQMSFALAYLISALAITFLVTIYSHSIFKSFKTTASMFSFWIILYSFLYFILQLEDFALLAGNIGLFIILAFVMYFSRKISFTNSTKSTENQIVIDNGDLL